MNIINPLDQIQLEPSSTFGVSTSSVKNDVPGTCPKCGSSMGIATIDGGAKVFYCRTDRVAQPLPDNLDV